MPAYNPVLVRDSARLSPTAFTHDRQRQATQTRLLPRLIVMAGWILETRTASDAILDEVRAAAEGIVASRYMSFAFFALLIYDHSTYLTEH